MRSDALLASVLIASLSIASGTSLAQTSNSAVHNGFLHELTTDASVYVMHEPVSITYTVTNVSEESIWLEFGCGGHAIFVEVDDPTGLLIFSDPLGCVDVMWDDIVDPGEFYAKAPVWDMFDYQVWQPIDQPGVYTVRGVFPPYPFEYAFELSTQITIVADETAVPEQVDMTWARMKALYRE